MATPVKTFLVVALLVVPIFAKASNVVSIGIKSILVEPNDRVPAPVIAVLVETILVKAGPAR
jgi:hypothetical protein